MHLKKFLRIGLVAFMVALLAFPVLPATLVHAAELDRVVSASADDCLVQKDTGDWIFNLTDGSNNAGYATSQYTNIGGGHRFQNITIPQGSTITAAYITFTANNSLSLTVVNTVLIGEDVDNAAVFSTLADYKARRGTIVGGANDDYITTASETWNNIPAWTAESEYESPSIVSIVQEIVNRPAWNTGNAMVIFWDDHAGNSTETDNTFRTTYAYDGTPTKTAELHIEYTAAGGGPIDIGAAATDRASSTGSGYTYIALDNPANDSGKLTSIEVYATTTITNLKVGTFYGSGGVFTNRDYANLGSISSGYQTKTTSKIGQVLSIKVVEGDYIGFWHDSGGVDEATTGGAGVYYATGNLLLGEYEGSKSYTLSSGYIVSVYGTGIQLNTIGSDPISSADDGGWPLWTRLDLNNPADKSGTITSVEVYSRAALTTLRVGTFYGSGLSWTNRDWEDLGAVSTGNQVIDSLSITVQVGDVIGCYFTTSGGIQGIYEPGTAEGSDGIGLCYLYGNYITGEGPTEFTYIANTRECIQGTITVAGEPIVTTNSATSVTTSSAQLNATIESTGGYTVTSRGFNWGLTSGYGNTETEEGSFGAGAFDAALSGLASGTPYHFRAWATNSQGTAYGSDGYFTTTSPDVGDPYPGYGYVQQFTIQGSPGGAGSNIQIPIHIYKGAGTSSGSSVYLENNAANFPNDIIFTSTDGITVLPFWQETSSATDVWVWVKIPYIPAYPSTTYGFISYGNPLVTISNSDGDATFTFFDDFTAISFEEYNSGTPVIPAEESGLGSLIGTHSSVYVNGVWHTYAEYMDATAPAGTYPYGYIWHWTSTDFINWTPDPNNPVIDRVPGTWIDNGPADPHVVYKDGTFYLFAGGCVVNGEPHDSRLGLWTSTNGSDFTEVTHEIFPTGMIWSDEALVWDSDASIWRGWVKDWAGVTDVTQAKNWYFTSPDPTGATGWNWSTGRIEITGLSGYCPFVSQVFKYKGTWYMLYFNPNWEGHSHSTLGNIGLATSTNFINWTDVKYPLEEGTDPKLDRQTDTYWYLTKRLKSDNYDTAGSTYSLDILEGGDFLSVRTLTDDLNWTNYLGSSASLSDNALKIDKTSQDKVGVQLSTQLPATALVGFKMVDYSSEASHPATVSILNKSGTGSATNEASVQQQNDSDIVGYTTLEGETAIGTGILSTWYNYVLELRSSTTISTLVRSFSPVVLTRTSTTINFLHIGWSGLHADFAIDNFFLGNLVTPNPTIISWTGGVAGNAVATNPASSITLTSAILNGTVTNIISGHTIDQLGFEYGTTTSYGTSWTNTAGTYGLGSFNSGTITGLTGNTTYHFRAKMHDSTAGTWTYGGDRTFTTTPTNLPVVLTIPAADITSTSATLQGTLSGLGDYSTIYVSFDYGTSTIYGQSSAEQTYTTVGGFSIGLTGLTQGDTYYYRAKARYSATEYVYGSAQSFTTITAGEPGINPPDTFLIEDVRIFSGFLEGDDLLIVSTYRLLYDITPVEVVGDYFILQVMDGGTLKCQGIPSSWGYRPASIYQAPGHSLTWGASYTEYLIGRSGMWVDPPENAFAIGPGSWVGDDLTILDSWVLATASRIGTYYGADLVVYISGYGLQLTTEGGNIFETAIPGLKAARPGLFSSGTREIKVDTEKRESTWREDFTPAKKLGEGLAADLDDLGSFFGLEGKMVGAVIWSILCLGVVAAGILVSGIPLIGGLCALPFCILPAAFGLVGVEYYIVPAVAGIICFGWVTVARGV